MSLPTFLGIGAQRAGSTWLHQLLASHPEVYMPTRRKEVGFFDLYYNRGQSWYETFFPRDTSNYRAVGEITPNYLHTDGCPERIKELLPKAKLIVILRNPVDRAYSHYKLLVKDNSYQGSFERALIEHPEMVEQGFYSNYFTAYLRHFDREQMLILVYEQVTKEVQPAKTSLVEFLALDPRGFSVSAGSRRIHESFVPKARLAYALAKRLSRSFHAKDMDWAVNLAKGVRIERAFGQARPVTAMDDGTRAHLQQLFAAEISRLEALLNIDLALWRQPTLTCERKVLASASGTS